MSNCFCNPKWINHFLLVLSTIYIDKLFFVANEAMEESGTGKHKEEKPYSLACNHIIFHMIRIDSCWMHPC